MSFSYSTLDALTSKGYVKCVGGGLMLTLIAFHFTFYFLQLAASDFEITAFLFGVCFEVV